MRSTEAGFVDTCLIYFDSADKTWIAHSLETDQVGVGDCVVDALVDLMTGTRNLLELARRDKTIAVFRKAPREIVSRAKKAKPLPDVVFQIALERFTNNLPKGYRIDVEAPTRGAFTAKIPEPIGA
ncbi:MAG: hypothetical protein FJ280_00360 [Planctomycetes bacterium]|nr:hypothetical protein [Planctomycetota bacterium]